MAIPACTSRAYGRLNIAKSLWKGTSSAVAISISSKPHGSPLHLSYECGSDVGRDKEVVAFMSCVCLH